MATIQQSNHIQRTHNADLFKQQEVQKEYIQDKISRGYDSENAFYERTDEEYLEEPIKVKHNLDRPAPGSDSPSENVIREVAVLAEMENHQYDSGIEDNLSEVSDSSDFSEIDEDLVQLDNLSPDQLKAVIGDLEAIVTAAEHPNQSLAGHIFSLESNRDELLAMGYSEEVIDGMLALADPNNPDNSLALMHSSIGQFALSYTGDDRLKDLSDLYADTLNKIGNLEDGPPELHAEIQKDLAAFVKQFVGPDKHMDVDLATHMLMQIQSKMQDTRLVFNQENIKINQAQREKIAAKRLEKIEKSIEQAEKSKKKGLLSKIFGYIAMVMSIIVTAIAAVALCVTGVGSGVAVALMVAVTVIMVTQTISSETGDWMNKGLASMFEAFGVSEKWSAMAGQIFMACVVLVMSFASFGAGIAAAKSAAANAAATAANAASQAGTTGATVSATATTAATAASKAATFTKYASIATSTAQAIGGAAMVFDGAASASATTLQYEADKLRADAKKLFAWMMANQHIIDDLTEDIKKVIEDMEQTWKVMTGMMKDNHDTKTKLNAAIKS